MTASRYITDTASIAILSAIRDDLRQRWIGEHNDSIALAGRAINAAIVALTDNESAIEERKANLLAEKNNRFDVSDVVATEPVRWMPHRIVNGKCTKCRRVAKNCKCEVL